MERSLGEFPKQCMVKFLRQVIHGFQKGFFCEYSGGIPNGVSERITRKNLKLWVSEEMSGEISGGISRRMPEGISGRFSKKTLD